MLRSSAPAARSCRTGGRDRSPRSSPAPASARRRCSTRPWRPAVPPTASTSRSGSKPGDASAVRLAAPAARRAGRRGEPARGRGRAARPPRRRALGPAPRSRCAWCSTISTRSRRTPTARGSLRDLVRRLPGNAHLLVGSRRLPEIGIARLAVGRQAEVLREADLRFTPEEIAEFARRRDVDPELLRAADGWPALAELLARSRGVDVDRLRAGRGASARSATPSGTASSTSPRSAGPTTRWPPRSRAASRAARHRPGRRAPRPA